MNETDQSAAVARLEATVDALSAAMSELRAESKNQTRQLYAIEARLSEAQGGLRVVLWLGGLATTIAGGIAVWAAKHLHWQ